MGGLESERADSRPKWANFRSERADFMPERADFRPERAHFRPERADFRPERASGGTHGRTNGRTKVPLCSTGLRPLWGRCPKSLKRNSLATIQLHGSLSLHAVCS